MIEILCDELIRLFGLRWLPPYFVVDRSLAGGVDVCYSSQLPSGRWILNIVVGVRFSNGEVTVQNFCTGLHWRSFDLSDPSFDLEVIVVETLRILETVK